MIKDSEHKIKTNFSVIIKLALIYLLMTNMNACGFLGIGATEKWKEEVQLSDGRIIVIDRKIVNESGGGEWASNRSGLKPKDYYIQFAHPDGSGKTIEWKSIKKSTMLFPEVPLILDIDSGNLVIYTIVGVRTACEAYSKYVYRNCAWNEETLPETFEPRITNLFVRIIKEIPEFINLETKRKINKKRHPRKPVRQVGPNREICG